jgi:XTP/dITP diphosphohydrolase
LFAWRFVFGTCYKEGIAAQGLKAVALSNFQIIKFPNFQIIQMSYSQSFRRLQNILNELREKCPWDKKQTIHSLRPQSVEELYELTDAISSEDWPGIKEELGDLLLHIVFYSKIAAEENKFTIEEVIESLCNKLVARHPHIYASVVAEDEAAVKKNWEQIKLKEGKKSVLSGVPKALPPIAKSVSIQGKVKQLGFEWDDIGDVKAKVKEEWNELEEAIAQQNVENTSEEFGDLLFSLINYARFLKIDPEEALEKTNKKFKFRFEMMEDMAAADNRSLNEMDLAEMDAYWEQAKKVSR